MLPLRITKLQGRRYPLDLMTIPNLIEVLAAAIARQEGFLDPTKQTRPKIDNNPGDLRAAPWLTHPKNDGGYWKADSIAEGIAGLNHQLALDIARGMTLRQLINSWAPQSDGNATSTYLFNVQEWTGIGDPEVPLWNYYKIPSLTNV